VLSLSQFLNPASSNLLLVLNHHWVPVAHACNSNYSGGRDQEDHSLKPAQTNSSMKPYLEKTNHKKVGGGRLEK
jgi:hypothetical protein